MKDRRQRRLYPTAGGEALALDIAILQSKRFTRVFGELPESARGQAIDFLLAMIDAGGRVVAMTGAGPAAGTVGAER